MTICIDTNALVGMLSLVHPARQILRAWQRGSFNWAISNEILSEYEEIIVPRIGSARWEVFLDALEIGSRLHGNLIFVQPDFRFRVISTDMDDNKFCDCAIAVHANWIVTEDRHFDVLRSETFRVKPIKVENFLARYFDQAGRFTP